MKKFINSLFPPSRLLAINEAVGAACSAVSDRCFAYALATNIAPMPREGDWMPMPEYGEVDYWTKENGVAKKYVQRFTPELARKMKLRLQAQCMREGEDFRGLPIYKGHPPANPDRWSDETRLGNVLDIDPHPDRARVKVALNDLGRKNQLEGYWVYPSPGWNYSEVEAQRTGLILPDELHHIGMTNMPRMASAKPWTNVDENPKQPAGDQHIKPMKKLLTSLLGLPEEANDDAINAAHAQALAHNAAPVEVPAGDKKIKIVIAGANHAEAVTAVNALATNVATAATELETARSLATNAAAEATKFKKLAINAHIDRAIDKGLITAAEKPQWGTDFEADFAAALVKLNAKKTALNTRELDPLKPVNDSDLSTPRGRQLAFNVRVDEIVAAGREDNPRFSIDDAIQKMRTNPADVALLKAMEPTAAAAA